MKTFKPDFYIVPTIVAEQCSPSDAMLFGIIYWMEKLRDGKCFASNLTLARMMPSKTATISSVSNSLNRLEGAGFIRRVYKDKQKRNRERICCLVKFGVTPTSESPITSQVNRDYLTGEQNKNIKKNKDKGEASSPDKLNKKACDKLIEWAENRRGKKFMTHVYGKQMKAFKIAKENKVSSQELIARWKDLEGTDFWKDKMLDWMNVVNSFNYKK